jgi:Zn-dependent protease/predicted transcriptional regulator
MAEKHRDGILHASIRLGRVAGIPIGLHYSWFVIAALITLSLAAQFGAGDRGWPLPVVWGVAVLTAVLFFATLLLHELAHALMAMARGIPVRSITLFALGGIAQMARDTNTAKTEFLVAIVGPIASFVVGMVCLAGAWALGWSPAPGEGATGVLPAVLGWLGSINLLLALFNLLPGYPLDGGRVLRAALWAYHGDQDRATRGAARAGQVVAGLFIAIGLVNFFLGAGLGGLWLAFIGWFLLSAAQASYAQVALTEALRDVRVADIMSNDCLSVEPRTTLQALVDDLLLSSGRRCVLVSQDGLVVGLVTPSDVRQVERGRWTDVAVTDVMRPFAQIRSVRPDTPVSEALETMAREDLNQLPVVERGRLEGIVTRGHILGLVQARSELSA